MLLGGGLLQAGRGAKEVAQEGTGNISILWFLRRNEKQTILDKVGMKLLRGKAWL